jgi:hypothetical protein
MGYSVIVGRKLVYDLFTARSATEDGQLESNFRSYNSRFDLSFKVNRPLV